jgi:hypothetical protein
LYPLPNNVRIIKSGRMGHVAHTRAMRTLNKMLVRKAQGERRLGEPRYRWDDNIKMDVRKMRVN